MIWRALKTLSRAYMAFDRKFMALIGVHDRDKRLDQQMRVLKRLAIEDGRGRLRSLAGYLFSKFDKINKLRRLIKDLSSQKTLLFLDEVKLDEENRYLEKLAIRVGEGDVGNVDFFMAMSPWNTGFVMDSYGNPQHHRDGQQGCVIPHSTTGLLWPGRHETMQPSL